MALRLMVIGDGGAPTGYARVIHGILRNLPKEQYDIHHLAVNYAGDPHEEHWKLYPAGNLGHIFGVNRIRELVERIQPQIVFCAADLWVQKLYLDELCSCTHKPRIIIYSPVDAGPVDPEWVERFPCASRVVAFTEYARSEILNGLGPEKALKVDVIPVGVDSEVFHPFNREKPWSTIEAKRQLGLFPDNELEDSFVVLNAHRNQSRKRIDITLKAFAAFAVGKPSNVHLYLHMGITDAGWNIHKLAKRYGIHDRLTVSENRVSIPNVRSEHLNAIYNACDVGLNTATGEGWGLPNFEHAAAGKAQVVPKFGALAEIWSEAAEFVEPEGEVVYEVVLSEGRVVDVEAVAAALERLYRDRERLQRVAVNCYERTQRDKYRWESISMRWHQVFQSAPKEATLIP